MFSSPTSTGWVGCVSSHRKRVSRGVYLAASATLPALSAQARFDGGRGSHGATPHGFAHVQFQRAAIALRIGALRQRVHAIHEPERRGVDADADAGIPLLHANERG